MCASRRTPPSALMKNGGGGNCGGTGGGGGRKSVSKSREILNLLGPESGGKGAETEDAANWPPGIMTRSRFVDCVV